MVISITKQRKSNYERLTNDLTETGSAEQEEVRRPKWVRKILHDLLIHVNQPENRQNGKKGKKYVGRAKRVLTLTLKYPLKSRPKNKL